MRKSLKTKSLSILLTLCMLIGLVPFSALVASADTASIELAETVESGATGVVFNTTGSVSDSWVAIYIGTEVPSDTSDYVDYVYVNAEDGTATFPTNGSRMKHPEKWQANGGIQPGTYLAVLFDSGYTVLAQKEFTVEGEVIATPKMSLEKTRFAYGEDVVFTYENAKTDNDWIGIYPDGSTSYGKWGYTPTGDGTWSVSGLAVGGYTAKFFYNGYSDDAHMYASIHFTVVGEAAEPSVTVNGKVGAGDAKFSVTIGGMTGNGWVAVYHSSRTAPAQYEDYLDVSGNGVYTFPSGQKIRQRYEYYPLGGTLAAGDYYIVLYQGSSYTELARTTFTATDDKTAFAVGKTIYSAGETVTFTYQKSHNATDFIAIYADGDEETILEQKDTPDEAGTVSFDGSWTKTAGTYIAKYYENGATDVVLATTTFTITDTELPSEGDGIYFMMYGGNGDGKTAASPAGSVDAVIESINADGYGKHDDVTLYVMDAPDALTYRPAIAGRGATDSHLTAWGNPTKVHTATIHVKGYQGVNSHIVTRQKFGDHVNASISGPVVFEDITFVRSRQYDEGMTSNGYSLTISPETVVVAYSSDFGTKGEVWDGKFANAYMVFIAGSDTKDKNVLGDNAWVEINNSSAGAEFYFAAWYETRAQYDEAVSLLVRDLKGKCVIWYSGSNDVTFKKAANILVGEAPEMTQFKIDKGSKTAVHDGAFQFIVNKHNPVAADYVLPSWITAKGGIYRLNVEADLLTFTDTDGLFYCTDSDKVAIATAEDGTTFYSDAEGYLMLNAGTYDVRFADASELEDKIVDIYCGDESYTAYKGQTFVLPTVVSTPFRSFKGFSYIDADENETIYQSGDKFVIPDGDETLFIFDEIWEDIPGVVGVFVSANGSDDDTGATRDHALYSLNKAYEVLKTLTGDKKIIAITGTYPFSGGTPKNTEMITLSGDGTGTSVFDLNNDYIIMNGPLTIENLKLTSTTTQGGKYFATNGNELVIGEGVEQVGKAMPLRFGVMSPASGTVAPKEKVTLKSGTFGAIQVGTYYNYSTPGKTAGAEIVIDGATVAGISLHSDGWMDTQRGNYFTDDVRITVKSGSLGAVTGTLGNPENSKAVGFQNGAKLYSLVNNSEAATQLTDFSAYCPSGAWNVYAYGKEGATLEYTETDGVYKVNGAKYALATSNSGEQIVSENGLLTLASGVYSVELTDEITYLFDGKNITIYSDCTIDVSKFTADSVDGKLFLGWTCGGTPVGTVGTYKAGDVITAEYIDFTTGAEGDFYIVGAQMRTEGVQGLRFILEKKDAFSEKIPQIIDFGTLVLPTEYTRGHDMKYGEKMTNEYAKGLPANVSVTTWEYNEPAIVKANKLYKTTSDGVQYTVCITGIDETRYDRFYTVKGYMRYRDLNDNERILYTEYYQTNLYSVALAALEAGETPTATFEGIKQYVEVDRMEQYMKENYDGRTPLATAKKNAAVSWQDTEGSANIPGIVNKDYYELKNGLKVREVEFDFSDGKERDDVTLIHFADTHLNSINDKDWEEADPCILSTYRGRVWNRNGSSVPAINTVMEYASFYDKIIATGDLMDYFSWGCAEMIQKLIIDRSYGRIVMANGNHEPARLMQNDDPSLKDTMSTEEKYARIQSIWTNDVIYYSEIVKNDDGDDMVMIISMDNVRYAYWDEQVEKLRADIEKARELGIKIMIFEHTPICTIPGGGEDWVTFFYEPGDTSGMTSINGVLHTNFGASNFAGSATKYTGATKEVYDLITNNAEIVRGVFCGDWHVNMYTEIKAKTSTGEALNIPQYVVTANAYAKGSAIKIHIK